jgi:hypothetical protein
MTNQFHSPVSQNWLIFACAATAFHIVIHMHEFWKQGLHMAVFFQATSCLSLGCTVRYLQAGSLFAISAVLATLHLVAWAIFHYYMPRYWEEQHHVDVFPLCSLLFFASWGSTSLMAVDSTKSPAEKLVAAVKAT